MSAYITDILDENNNTLYPTTKYNAVFDSNGSTLPSDFSKLEAHPVGSIYISVDSTSPASLFGGTWTQLKDRFLLGCGDTYTNGQTGGSEQHTHRYGINLACYYGEVGFEYAPSGVGVRNYTDQSNFTSAGFSADGTCSPTMNVSTQAGSSGISGVNSYKSAGNVAYQSNMPPYLVIYMWKRTA